MTGQVKLDTKIINNKTKEIMKLRSKADRTKHTILTGGLYSVNVYYCCVHVHSIYAYFCPIK